MRPAYVEILRGIVERQEREHPDEPLTLSMRAHLPAPGQLATSEQVHYWKGFKEGVAEVLAGLTG